MYTYAFLKTPIDPIAMPIGIENSVQFVSNDLLSAVVEADVSLDELKNDDATLMQAVLSHDRVIRELFLQTTILPLRFGTCFPSLQSLLAHLDANQQTYLDKLTQFEGKAEYSLKFYPLPFPEVSVPPETKGKDYFLAKKKQYQTQLDYQAQQRKEFESIAQTVITTYPRLVMGGTQSEVTAIYLLVDRSQENQLYEAFSSWQLRCPSWQMNIGEALPPYHSLGE